MPKETSSMSNEKQMLTLMLQEHHSNSLGKKPGPESHSGESSSEMAHMGEDTSESGMGDSDDHAYPPGLGYGNSPRKEGALDGRINEDDDSDTSTTLHWTGDVMELDPSNPKCVVDGNTVVEHIIEQERGPFQLAFPLAGVKMSDDTIEEVRRQVAVTHSHVASVARKGTMRAVDLDCASARKPHRFEVLSNSRRVYDLEACEGVDGSSYIVCTDGMYDIAVSRFSPCLGARRDSGIAGCELYIHLEGEDRSEISEVHWCPLSSSEKITADTDAHDDEDNLDHVFFTVHADGSLCFWILRHVRAVVAAGSHPPAANCPQGFSRVSIEVAKCEDVCLRVYKQAAQHYKDAASVDGDTPHITHSAAEGRVTASLSSDGTRLATACGSHVRYFTVNPTTWEVHFLAEHDISSGEEVRGLRSAIIGCTETLLITLEKALIIALQFKGEIQVGQIVRFTGSSPVAFVGSVDAVTIEAPADTSSVDTEELTVEAPSETLTIALLTQPSTFKSYWMLLSAGCVTFHEVQGIGLASGFVAHSNPDPSVYTVVTWSVEDPEQPKYQYLYSNGAVLELDRVAATLETAKGAEKEDEHTAVVEATPAKDRPQANGQTNSIAENSKSPTSGMKASDLLKRMLKLRGDTHAAPPPPPPPTDTTTAAALEVSGAPLPGEISSGEEAQGGDAKTSSDEQSESAEGDPSAARKANPKSPTRRGSSETKPTGAVSESAGSSSLSPRKIPSQVAAPAEGDEEEEEHPGMLPAKEFVPTSEPLNARQVRKFIRFLADTVQAACQKTIDAASSTAEGKRESAEAVEQSLSTEVEKLSKCLADDMTPEALTHHMMHSDKVWRGVRRLSNSINRASDEVSTEMAKSLPGIVKELFTEKAVPAVVKAMQQKITEIDTFEQPDSTVAGGALDGLSDRIVRVDQEVRGLGTRLAEIVAILQRTEQQAGETITNQQESVLGLTEMIERMKSSGGSRSRGSAASVDASQVSAAVAIGLQDDIAHLNNLASHLRAEIDSLKSGEGTPGEAPPSSSYLQPDPRPDWQRVKEYLRSQQYHWAVATALELRENAASVLPPVQPASLREDLVGFACCEVDKLATVDSFVRSVAGVDSPSRTWPQEKCDRLNLALMQMLRLVDYLVWASSTSTSPEDLRSLESVVRVIGLDADAVEELCSAGAAERPDMVKQSLSRVIARLRAVKCRSSGMRLAVTELRSHLLSIQNEGVFRRPQISGIPAAMLPGGSSGSGMSPLMSDAMRSPLGSNARY